MESPLKSCFDASTKIFRGFRTMQTHFQWWFSAKTPLARARIAIFPCFTQLCHFESKPPSMHNETRIWRQPWPENVTLPDAPLSDNLHARQTYCQKHLGFYTVCCVFNEHTMLFNAINISLFLDKDLVWTPPFLYVYIYIHIIFHIILSNYPKVVQNRWPGWQIMLDSDWFSMDTPQTILSVWLM